MAGPAVDRAEDAAVDLDEVRRFLSGHGLLDGLPDGPPDSPA